MPHRILHLSDTHVTASGFDSDGVDALAALDQILRDCRHLTGLDLVVVTGDIADDGSAEGCALVRERVGRFAAGRGIPHIYATGNHDRRPGGNGRGSHLVCGHFHLQLTGQLNGTTVWVTPGVVTRIDLTAPPHIVRAVNGASATVVELGGSFSPSAHVIHARDPQAGKEVYIVDSITSVAAAED